MNPTRQVLHILGKDIRFHALEIGIVLLLNVILTLALTEPWPAVDFAAVDTTVRPDEWKTVIGSTTQVLLVLAWCVLIGRVVQEDGVAGKAPYWLTRPWSRPVLLASKLAFVLLFVHLPIFLSHAVIVTGSGLPLSLTQMLADQVVFAAVVSLPLMALATLTTSFVRFVFVGVAVAASLVAVAVAVAAVASFAVVGSNTWDFYFFPSVIFSFLPNVTGGTASNFFLATMLASLMAVAGIALVCQYRWRATMRVAVWSAVALCLLGLGTLALSTPFVMRAFATPPQIVASTIRLGDPPGQFLYEDPRVRTKSLLVVLPIEATFADDARIGYTDVEIRSAAGAIVEQMHDRINGLRHRSSDDTWSLILLMSPADYDALKESPVSIRLVVEFSTYEFRELGTIPRDGTVALVGGRAQCGIRDPRSAITCRTSFGWSMWSLEEAPVETGLAAFYELRQPVRLRFAIDPISYEATGNPAISARERRRVSYTRQDVTFENIRLADWEP